MRRRNDAPLAPPGEEDEGVPLSQFLNYMRSRSTECGGCWLWTGGTSENGAPVVHRHTGLKKPNGHALMQTLPARRAVAEHVAAGPMPKGFVSALLCEHPLCVSPWHIAATTKPRQARHSAKRGAWSSAKKTAAITAARRRGSRYSEAVIEYVRTSTKPGKDIALETGMSTSHVSSIRLGKRRAPARATPFSGLVAGHV